MLQQLRVYAANISDSAGTIDVPTGLLTQRDEVKEFSDQIIREIDAPLRIGFVGEFGAGKFLLLGVLVGIPDLLPVSSEPTTGNVTELRFMRADDRAATGIRRVQLPEADLASLEAAEVRDSGFRDWCANGAGKMPS